MKQKNPFLSTSLSSLLFKFSAPAVAGMIANALYNIIARLLVGNEVGHLGIAGITVTFPITIIFMAFSAFIGVGGNALFSIALGKKKYGEAENIMGNTIILLVSVSIAIAIFTYLFLDELLILFGASENVLPYAKEYMDVAVIGFTLWSIGAGMNHFIRSSGHPKIALMTQIIGNVVNVIVGPLFIYILHWGMTGAALAGIFGQVSSFIWIFLFFFGKKSTYKIKVKYFVLKLNIIFAAFAIGVSQLVFQLSSCFLNLILNRSLVYYGGDTALAAIGIVMAVNSLILFTVFGISQGTQPLVGYNYGARHFSTAIQTTKMAIRWSSIILIIGFFITEIFAVPIVKLFNSTDENLIAMAARGLRFVNFMLPVISFHIFGSTYFQAINKPVQATFLSLARQVLLLIPFVLILPLFFGLDGVFLATTFADFFACLISAILLYHYFHKYNQKLF
ncbi:MAG: MATE family efflux transporter [Elusimicrobia bacterium]|nr:MATE family efflux transporter [Elusimicrobiota bacterium]